MDPPAVTAILRRVGAQHVRAIWELVDAWNRDDLEGWLSLAHPEIEWSSATMRQLEGAERVYRGHAELRRFWEEWRAVWNFEIELLEAREVEGGVFAEGVVRARGAGSGISYEQRVGYAVEFEGDLIRRANSFRDPAEALAALGET